MALRESDRADLPIPEIDPTIAVHQAMDFAIRTFPTGPDEYHLNQRQEEALRTILHAYHDSSAISDGKLRDAHTLMAFRDMQRAIPLVQRAFALNAQIAQRPTLATALGFFQPLDILTGRLAALGKPFTPQHISLNLADYLQKPEETTAQRLDRVEQSFHRMKSIGSPDVLLEQLVAERRPLPISAPSRLARQRRLSPVAAPLLIIA